MTASFISRHKAAFIRTSIISGIVFVVGVFISPWIIIAPDMESCTTFPVQELRGSKLYRVQVLEKDCDGIAGTVTVEVALIPRKGGAQKIVFSYSPTLSIKIPLKETYPRITWRGSSHLKIIVKAVAEVEKKLSHLDRVHIQYDIGSIEYK